MRQRSLIRKLMSQFVVCVAVLFMLATPLFYWLTENYYAEDMADLREAVAQGAPLPACDLEEDVMEGIIIQYVVISVTLSIAVLLMLRLMAKRLWAPFDRTLELIEQFRLEDDRKLVLPMGDVREFNRLNDALGRLMANSLASYHAQKEFTENASHELQTPLAIFQTKLDLLLQQPGLTREQADIIQDLYRMNSRLARLNRNLLLLAKIDNGQFDRTERVQLQGLLDELLPCLDSLSAHLHIQCELGPAPVYIQANRALLESMINNLMVNAVRHNRPDGVITISATAHTLTVSNTSDEPALDATHIFNRFYRPTQHEQGNGLGLAIVKAVCDYHGWNIGYHYDHGVHSFEVHF